jgi:solute carrier family 30 (zinc transporter), member 9
MDLSFATMFWNYTAWTGEDVVEALGYEVDRLESEIQKLVPGIKHVDIEAHNPEGLALRAEVL